MRETFDRRVLPDDAVTFVRECQNVTTCHLGGGSALSGAWLVHRLSRDVDLFCHDSEQHRALVQMLPAIARKVGVRVAPQRDAGTFVRSGLALAERSMELDIVFEPMTDLAPVEVVEGVLVESSIDLRASKITCILSRSEPRDLVDLMFLERAGFGVPDDLLLAARKDGGVDPGVLAWLLSQFPVEPLPDMLVSLEINELRAFRDDLAERLRHLAIPK